MANVFDQARRQHKQREADAKALANMKRKQSEADIKREKKMQVTKPSKLDPANPPKRRPYERRS